MAEKTIITVDDLIEMGAEFKFRELTEQDKKDRVLHMDITLPSPIKFIEMTAKIKR